MPILGREFCFAFSHCTRVDVAFGHLGDEATAVDLEVYDGAGERVHRRRFADVPALGSVSTRHDPESDNLARFAGPNHAGLVVLRGADSALLTASYLCVGKGITCCAVLPPVAVAAHAQFVAPIAMGRRFQLIVANPHSTEAQVLVEVSTGGAPFHPLQPQFALPRHHVRLTEDALALGKPAILRLRSLTGAPVMAWGLGIGQYRSELYPLSA